MNVAVKAGLILAGLVALFSIVFYVAGLHRNFMVGQMIFLVVAIAINVAVVYWALAKTAATNGYGGQLVNALIIGVVGGVLITLASWILLSWVFPDALGEARQAAVEFMEASGTTGDEFEKGLEQLENTTPMSQSLPGGAGAFFTSLVTGAIVAIFKRRR